MFNENGLSIITVQKKELLGFLKNNRAEHNGYFLKAQEGYKKQFIMELENSLAEAKAGRNFRRSVSLDAPIDHTRDYDRIIKMLEMSVKDEVQITEREFSQYVQDDWAWKHDFIATNSSYI